MLDIIDTSDRYSATHVAPYSVVISKGDGIYVYDHLGKPYIDMVSGISVVNVGYRHPRLINALVTQANKIAIVPRLFHNEPLAQLLQTTCELSAMDQAIPMNSGAEAVETAIKLARKWVYTVKHVTNNKAEIITCDNSFHGRTITTVSMSSIDKYKANFGPLTPGFISIPFNDISALQHAITPNTAAFIVEPIQGEAGFIIPDANYLKTCEQICRDNNVLFILDEIQTGMGRTGKFLASQHQDIHPDGILLGKALGGGLLPISLFLGKKHLMDVIRPGEHGSTFAGNPLASAVACEAINVLIDEKLCDNAVHCGHYFMDKLRQINSPAIAEIRGKGLLIAIGLNTNVVEADHVCRQLIEKGLLSINTRNQSIRLLPPLTITTQQIDHALEIIEAVFSDISTLE